MTFTLALSIGLVARLSAAPWPTSPLFSFGYHVCSSTARTSRMSQVGCPTLSTASPQHKSPGTSSDNQSSTPTPVLTSKASRPKVSSHLANLSLPQLSSWSLLNLPCPPPTSTSTVPSPLVFLPSPSVPVQSSCLSIARPGLDLVVKSSRSRITSSHHVTRRRP